MFSTPKNYLMRPSAQFQTISGPRRTKASRFCAKIGFIRKFPQKSKIYSQISAKIKDLFANFHKNPNVIRKFPQIKDFFANFCRNAQKYHLHDPLHGENANDVDRGQNEGKREIAVHPPENDNRCRNLEKNKPPDPRHSQGDAM